MLYMMFVKFFTIYLKRHDLKIIGLENLPKKGPYLVAANHASYLDHIVTSWIVATHTKNKVKYLAKKEHFEGTFQKWWHENLVNAIPIDRDAGGKEALETAVKELKKGAIIGIYPEGTRTLTGKMQKAKTGIARLVLEAKVPVLPIGLRGTFKVLPKGKNIPKKGKIEASIGKLIYFNDYYKKRVTKKLLRQITNKVMKEIAKLAKQKYEY